MGISSLGSIETHPAQIHFQTLKTPIFRHWKRQKTLSDPEIGIFRHWKRQKTIFRHRKHQFSGNENTHFQALKTPIFKHWKHPFSSTENTRFQALKTPIFKHWTPLTKTHNIYSTEHFLNQCFRNFIWWQPLPFFNMFVFYYIATVPFTQCSGLPPFQVCPKPSASPVFKSIFTKV